MRAGAYALSVLSDPLDDHVLSTLAEGPRSLEELRRAVGSPPETTLRSHLRTLVRIGAITRNRQRDFPGSVDYELAAAGRELIAVRDVLGAWLMEAPGGPISLGSQPAKSAVKALLDGWSTGIVRVLAAKPLSLTELSGLITTIRYPSLERRVGAMRLAGLIERTSSCGRGTPYAVTQWLCTAVGPLVAAARWERGNLRDETEPIKQLDAQAAFLLAVPLLWLDPELAGTCRLGVEMRDSGGELNVAGVTAHVDGGRIVACATRLHGPATAWASGSAAVWMRALIDGRAEELEIGGDAALAIAVIEGLHQTLYRPESATTQIP